MTREQIIKHNNAAGPSDRIFEVPLTDKEQEVVNQANGRAIASYFANIK